MYPQIRSVRLYLALATLSVAACTGETRGTSPILTGSMRVTVTSTQGVKPAVTITGPNGYNKTITSTQTLTGLPIGDYSVAADSVVQPDPVVGTLVDSVGIKGNPAAIQTGDTAKVTVTYALKSRTGALWIANNATSVLPVYAAAQLEASGTPTPAESLVTWASGPAGIALDSKGNMWESDFGSEDSVFMYSAAARAGDSTTPSAVMVSTAIQTANNIAIDSKGDLWVADGDGWLFEYTPTQLAAADSQTPTLQINLPDAPASAYALTFDSNGNLWVGDNSSNNHILEYTAAQLVTTGPTCTPAPAQCSPAPADTIGSNGNSINSPSGLAFDSQGNLWVSNASGGTIVEFTPAQIASNGAPVPQVTITAPSGAVPNGLAIDNSGSIWVSSTPSGSPGGIYKFTTAQIATTGSPTPAITIAGALGLYTPAQLLFDPGSPIQAPAAARVRGAHAPVSRVGRLNPSLARALRR